MLLKLQIITQANERCVCGWMCARVYVYAFECMHVCVCGCVCIYMYVYMCDPNWICGVSLLITCSSLFEFAPAYFPLFNNLIFYDSYIVLPPLFMF